MKDNKSVLRQNKSSKTESETVVRPFVDVQENDENVQILADVPGVSRENLVVEIEGDRLTIEGKTSANLPEGGRWQLRHMNADVYRRSFTFKPEIDSKNIEASLVNGLLTITLPKKQAAQPRKIEVRAA